jgi:hypothetical protein
LRYTLPSDIRDELDTVILDAWSVMSCHKKFNIEDIRINSIPIAPLISRYFRIKWIEFPFPNESGAIVWRLVGIELNPGPVYSDIPVVSPLFDDENPKPSQKYLKFPPP